MPLTRVAHTSALLLLIMLATEFIESAEATPIVFASKAAFSTAAPIEITQDFESLASPTVFPTPQVEFDGVIFSATPSPSVWVIDDSVGVLRSNTLGTLQIVGHEITFGQGGYVTAFGFTFLGGGSSNGVPARYEIGISEINGTATIMPLALFPGTYYFGFLSQTGIDALSVAPVLSDGFAVFWRYDDFSRSSISAIPEPTSLSFLSIGAVMLVVSVRRLGRPK